MKSFRDDLIDRMKTGWGRFVLASSKHENSSSFSMGHFGLLGPDRITAQIKSGSSPVSDLGAGFATVC
jgi:hypothetical protein